MMGFFTAVGGGMLRDGFMGVVPGIFQRTNFYAIAAIAGSASYVCLVMSGLVSNVVALVVCVVVTMGLRWLSLRFDIKSPTEDDIARFCTAKVGGAGSSFEMQPRGSFRAPTRWVPC